MSKTKKIYSGDFKAKVVLELLSNDLTINQIASKYDVTPQSVMAWKKQFLENASQAFESNKMSSEYKKEIDELKTENEQLAKALGKTTVERDWAVGKLKALDSSNRRNLIEFKDKTLPLSAKCELLELNRSSIYYKPKPLSEVNSLIIKNIDEIYSDNADYGYRQMHKQLTEELGFRIGKERVLKYMNILGIHAIRPKVKKLTSIKEPSHKIYPYLLLNYHNKQKQVIVDNPNEIWSGDITYIKVNGGFMYLAAVIDWHSRAILSYKISNTMDAELATSVLQDAITSHGKPKIFNSDQGSQYTSYTHTQILKDNNIQISMNGKGRSIDNICIERFFRTLKYGCIYISDYQSIAELKQGVQNYIYKYNYKRFHSAIGYKKPMNVYLDGIKKEELKVA